MRRKEIPSSERIVSAMKGLVIVGLLLAVFISDAPGSAAPK
jgi:hypothetical protein